MKIEARSGYRKICLKMGLKSFCITARKGRDEKECRELSVKSLSGSTSQRMDILDLNSEDY